MQFAALAAQLAIDPAAACILIKRFAGGDVAGALHALPTGAQQAAGAALQQAFGVGFTAVAMTAASVAVASLALTRWLLPDNDPKFLAASGGAALAVPGE